MWQNRGFCATTRARVFWTRWRRVRFETDVPARRELQESSLEPTIRAAIKVLELNWIELNWTELNWIELNWIELNWIELNCIALNWIELNWIEWNWIELNWIELNWIGIEQQNNTHCIRMNNNPLGSVPIRRPAYRSFWSTAPPRLQLSKMPSTTHTCPAYNSSIHWTISGHD